MSINAVFFSHERVTFYIKKKIFGLSMVIYKKVERFIYLFLTRLSFSAFQESFVRKA